MQDGPEVKVMSFNIRYGSARDDENRRDLVFDVLHEQQSDVVGLQEAECFQLAGGRYPSDHFPVIARLRLPTLPGQ